MKFAILFMTVVFVQTIWSQDCSSRLKYKFGHCCWKEPFNDEEKLIKIADSFKGTYFSHIMKECKGNEVLFKELGLIKDGEVDIEAADKYLETAFNDKSWIETHKTAAEMCNKEVMANLPSIQAKYEAEPFNMKRTDCDVKFMAIHSCVSLETFITCPKTFMNSSEECDHARSWFHKCVRANDVHSIVEMMTKYAA